MNKCEFDSRELYADNVSCQCLLEEFRGITLPMNCRGPAELHNQLVEFRFHETINTTFIVPVPEF